MIYTFTPEHMGIYVNKGKKNIDQIKAETGADVICNLNLYNNDWTGAAYTRADYQVVGTDGYGYYGFGFDTDSKRFNRAWSSENGQRNFFGCWDAIADGLANAQPVPAFTDNARRRTVIGMLKDGKIGIYCNTVLEYPEVLKKNLLAAGFTEAVVLDGGGSTQLRCPNGNVYSSDPGGYRIVHTLFWAQLPKAPWPECPYKEPSGYVRLMSIGEGAKWLQWQLKRHGASLTVDGIIGPISWSALKKFQAAHGLVADGICGNATKAELKK